MGVANASSSFIHAARAAKKLTAGSAMAPCGAFVADAAGSITFVDLDGNTCTNFPAQAGYNPIGMQSLTTAAIGVWGLY